MPHGARIVRLHHVSLGTPNLSRLVSFYCSLLGGEIAHEFLNREMNRYGAFIYFGNGTFIELFKDDGVDKSGKSGFRHLSFEVDDIESVASYLRLNGYAPVVARGRTDKVLQCFVEDPDGNVVELQQHDDESSLIKYLQDRAK